MSDHKDAWWYVRGFEQFSLCDWPGHPCCVIFLGGCNLQCPTCHNRRLAWNMDSLDPIPSWGVKAYLAERGKWLDGVTITGGEPTGVPCLAQLLWDVKKTGLPVKLDTNGMNPEVVEELLGAGLVDVFAVDVKGPYEMYPMLTGELASPVRARQSLERIFALAEQHPAAFYFRQTRVPGLTDSDVQVSRNYLPRGFSLIIQDFVPPRREHATADHEERRPVGDVVH